MTNTSVFTNLFICGLLDDRKSESKPSRRPVIKISLKKENFTSENQVWKLVESNKSISSLSVINTTDKCCRVSQTNNVQKKEEVEKQTKCSQPEGSRRIMVRSDIFKSPLRVFRRKNFKTS